MNSHLNSIQSTSSAPLAFLSRAVHRTYSAVALFCLLLLAPVQVRAADSWTELSSPNAMSGGLFGGSAKGLPDLTGDGVGELWVGAYGETVEGFASAGRGYVFNGATLALLYKVESPEPAANRNFGVASGEVDSAGDITDDGIDDLMVGEPGANSRAGMVRFYDGSNGAFLFSISSPEPNFDLGAFGAKVQRVSDMTGDDHDDWLIIQAEYRGSAGGGKAFIFDSQFRTSIRTIANTEPDYQVGIRDYSLAIPDVNGDGQSDLLIGNPFMPATRDGQTFPNAGRAFVRSGATGEVLYELRDPDQAANRFFAEVNRGIGDIDGDQVGDIAIGSHWPDGEAGIVYLFSGADGHWIRTLRGPNRAGLTWFGWTYEPLPDINGDGRVELWVNHQGRRTSYVFDGASGAMLKTIPYPPFNQGGSSLATIHQTSEAGIHAFVVAENLQGGSGRVFVQPFTSVFPPLRLQLQSMIGNSLKLSFSGEPASHYILDYTATLTDWISIRTNTFDSTGNDDFTVSIPAGEPNGFYRTRQAGASGWRFVSKSGLARSSRIYVFLSGAGSIYLDHISLVQGDTPETGANHVLNGDFESDLSGPWFIPENYASSRISQEVRDFGDSSLYLVANGPANPSTLVRQELVPIATNQMYTLSFWYLPTTNQLNLTVRLSDNSINVITNVFAPASQ